MQVKGFALALAALLAGASAATIQPVSADTQLSAHIAVRSALLSDMRTEGSAKAKRCFTDKGDTICIDCYVMGDDDCCYTTDLTTGEAVPDGCEYFGGAR